jgi:DNA-binding transcriptional ArsR family regulator
VAERQLDEAELVRYMFTHSTVTVPHVAKTFKVDPKTASYHLEKLTKQGLIVKKEKKYGSKYMLNPEITKTPTRFYLQAALTFSPTILGIILLINQNYPAASTFLAASSIIGASSSLLQLKHYQKQRLEEILTLLKKRAKSADTMSANQT